MAPFPTDKETLAREAAEQAAYEAHQQAAYDSAYEAYQAAAYEAEQQRLYDERYGPETEEIIDENLLRRPELTPERSAEIAKWCVDHDVPLGDDGLPVPPEDIHRP